MKKPKSPKMPEVAAPVPVPQPDDPKLIDVSRRARFNARDREGSRASLLTPGGYRGVGSEGGSRRRLGLGAIGAYGS